MRNTRNTALASQLEKLASDMEAYAETIEQETKPASSVKTAATTEYGQIDSRPAPKGEDAISRWLFG